MGKTSNALPWSERTLFLTGGTGFIGSEIMRQLLSGGARRIFVLVRGADEAMRLKKVERALTPLSTRNSAASLIGKRVVLVHGDVTRRRLGLSEADRGRLLEEVNHLIHCAANVSFGTSLEEHLVQNLWGTRYMLDLAEDIQARSGGVKKFDYIGTAFIAGTRQGLIREDELECGQDFNNSYEESKYHSEIEVLRRSGPDFPVTRFRPSIVVGDQHTGHTSSFKMIYWLIRVYQQGLWRMIPARADAVVDLIPVNLVAESILALSPKVISQGRSIHLAAGPKNSARADELAELVRAFFNGPKVHFISPKFYQTFIGPPSRFLARGKLKRILTKGRVYTPYFVNRKIFDTANLERGLVGTGIAIPRVTDYFTRLLEFCMESDWGKRKGS